MRLLFECVLALVILGIGTQGCGPSLISGGAISSAHADDLHISSVMAADGTFCYVLMQNGAAVGLSCK